MQSVSSTFLAAAKATVRKVRAKVEVVWTDPYIDISVGVTANEQNRASATAQAADLKKEMAQKWFVLGENRLDGSHRVFPSTTLELLNNQVGWYGATQSGSGGAYSAPYPTLTVTFAPRPVYSLLVVGSTACGEYPVDFTVKIYDSTDTLLHTETVTGNPDIYWMGSISVGEISTATKMVLEITKWSKAGAVAKIAEFYTRIVEAYEGDDIVSLSFLEESEVAGGSLPIGNISANELDLSLQNIEDRFFSGNTASPLHTQIKRGRKILAWLGFELPDATVEYVPLGVFWSGDWDTPEMGTEARTSARDRMEQLRKAMFTTSEVYVNKNLKELAEIVLEDARVRHFPDLQYIVGGELEDFVVPYAWFDRMDYMGAIRQIVEACMGWAYVDRQGVVRILGRLSDSFVNTSVQDSLYSQSITWQDTYNTPPAYQDRLGDA